MDNFMPTRKSSIELDKIYFWTATIRNWHHLLEGDSFKEVIIQSIENLSKRHLIDVFGFVIMPNHIHLIWRLKQFNGKELPSASLLKFTAHQFKKILNPSERSKYEVILSNKKFEFWQRDSLAIELYSPDVAYQKLEYIHLNPLVEKWNLAKEPSDYKFSSASFYEKDNLHYRFLKHIGDEF
jgi:putative transposase